MEDYLLTLKNKHLLLFIAAKEINDTTVEIKNLLTLEKYRGHGYGKALIQHIEKLYQNKLTFFNWNCQ